jgi:small subunit ribosomal protein S16
LLRIRLSRVGKRKQPAYRLVVADSHAPRDGAFIEIIGHYNPLTEPSTLVVKEDEAVEWLRRGAQPSETAAKLLSRIGVMERAGRAPVVWDRTDPVKPKKAAEEAAPAAPTAIAAAPAPAAAEKPPPEAAAEKPPAEAATEAPEAEAAAEAPEAEAAAETPEAEAAAEAPEAEAAAETSEAEAAAEGEPAGDTEPTEEDPATE